MSEKRLTDSERHELWLDDIEARLRFLEALHTPAFNNFEEQGPALLIVSRIKPEGDNEHGDS